MTLGTFGSTLSDELNRLANGGTYRDMDDMVDEALAAKQWANRENISPYSTDTVGVLNEIAGLGLNKKNWLDFNGICNYIAGTTGLPAAAALRQVYATTDLLTGVASYYVDATDASASTQTITNLGTAGSLLPTTLGSSTAADSNDPKFLDHTGTNYVYTPGVSGNALTVPDAADLRVTGDIDVRAYVALDDWTPSAQNFLIAKANNTITTNRGYSLRVNTNGTLSFVWSPDGTVAAQLGANSTVAPTVTDGTPLWIRATLDVDNGASGNDVKFYTSPDGVTWTQLGTTVTTAGVTSIFASTVNVTVGADSAYSSIATAKIYRAQILNGIDGTTVLDVDTSVITAGSATSFTAVTGQTVTINRSTSGRKSVAVTQPTWLFGTDDFMEVNNRYMASGNYLYLPGVASNFASSPDSAALDITGDIDLRCKVAMDDWTPAATSFLIAKRQTGSTTSYSLSVLTTGALRLSWTTDGTTLINVDSTVATGITDGATKWVRGTLDVDNGASPTPIYVVKFWLSDDGTTWTQLGADVNGGAVTSIHSGTSQIEVGSIANGTANVSRGKFFRAQVLDGIGGTVAFDADFETSITSLLQTTFTESSLNAATVTINRSGSAFRSAGITEAGYLYPGATNTFTASATDFLNFGAADSFTVLAVSRNFATLGTNDVLVSKKDSTTNTVRGYLLSNGSSTAAQGQLQVGDGAAGATAVSASRTAGALSTVVGVRNVATDNLLVYNNAVAGSAVTDATTTTSSFFDTLRIARLGLAGTEYNDVEIYAAAIFRQALTATQIRQISNYFANREVYL